MRSELSGLMTMESRLVETVSTVNVRLCTAPLPTRPGADLPPAKFSVFTPISDIKPGQTYAIPPGGSLGMVADSTAPDARSDGFRFFNEGDKVSPVVFQTIEGQKTAVCFTDDYEWRDSGYVVDLSPLKEFVIWFSKSESGTMIFALDGPPFGVDMNNREEATVTYNDGWSS